MGKRIVGRPRKITCILCNKIIKKDEPKTIIPVDKPVYLNIIVHRRCREKTDENTLKNVVIQHIQGLL